VPYKIIYGYPDISEVMEDLETRHESGTLDENEKKFFKKLVNCFNKLSLNPFHNSLNSHDIPVLTKKAGEKIFTSYVENNTPGAARIFWFYGPNNGEITIAAIEPHPESGEYGRVKLSTEPKPKPKPKPKDEGKERGEGKKRGEIASTKGAAKSVKKEKSGKKKK
jgi:hypothetical protein